jgi:hypothetical protein
VLIAYLPQYLFLCRSRIYLQYRRTGMAMDFEEAKRYISMLLKKIFASSDARGQDELVFLF